MRVTNKEYITLLTAKMVSFDSKGEKVEYGEFVALDEDGQVISGTIKKSMELPTLEQGETLRGIGEFGLVPTDIKNRYKLQMYSFEVM